MKKTNILIVGGGPASLVVAGSARKNNPSKHITLIRSVETSVIPCGIPYVFNRLDSVEKNILTDKSLEANNVDIVINTVVKVNPDEKIVEMQDGSQMEYEKLILATGSKPTTPNIEGIDKDGVWFVKKNFEYLKRLREAVHSGIKDIVIVGGGFIGVEFAEELSNVEGLTITVVEMLDTCLANSFDKEFSETAQDLLRENGVIIETGTYVQKINGNQKTESVSLSNGKDIPADMVILSVGAKPNVDLIENTEIRLGSYGGIWVDEYMQTSVSDVYAIGDCSETRNFITGRHEPVMLASTATVEARILGSNLYGKNRIKDNKGILNAFTTSIYGIMFGSVGLTEQSANKYNYNVVIGTAKFPNHHPGSLPDTAPVVMKLIFSKKSGLLLGGQVMGTEGSTEMTNLISCAIQKNMTAYEMEYMVVATHPLVTPAPTVTPIIVAASDALKKL